MKKLFIVCPILLYPCLGFALELCPGTTEPISTTSNESFTLSKGTNREWVNIRFIIQKDGRIGDAKPIEYSTATYNRKATNYIKKWIYKPQSTMCYKDIILYKTGM